MRSITQLVGREVYNIQSRYKLTLNESSSYERAKHHYHGTVISEVIAIGGFEFEFPRLFVIVV